MLKVLAATVAVASATDLCLPSVHSTYASVYSDRVDDNHDHPQELKQGEHLHMWVDVEAQNTLVHVHEDNPRRGHSDPAHGVLTNYKEGVRYSWDFDEKDRKVVNCHAEKIEEKLERFCVSRNATQHGSGTIGESLKVDFFGERVEDRERGLEGYVETIMESRSTSRPVQQRSQGMQGGHDHVSHFYEQVEWFDFNETRFDQSVFAVPSECKAPAVKLGATAGTRLCLPDVHETFVSTFSDRVSESGHSHHPEEYKLGDHLHLWFDMTAKKTLTYVHDENPRDDHHHSDPDHGFLRDYSTGTQYSWDWDARDRKVVNCRVEKLNSTLTDFCLSTNATLGGSGTIGETLKVDFYHTEVNDEQRGVRGEEDAIFESGSTSRPAQSRAMGEYRNQQGEGRFFEQREWYNFTEATIPAAQFAVPAECKRF